MVRAATVAEVSEYRLRIHFDGWDDIYDDWFESESLDLYPCGWCEKTGHPLETPLSKFCSILQERVCSHQHRSQLQDLLSSGNEVVHVHTCEISA